jgi:hypothetical protein
MTAALTTIDLLIDSVRHSYVAANELILRSCKRAADPAPPPAGPDAALHREAEFIINNVLGNPPVAIPLVLFRSPVRYYLSALRFDLPCYTLSAARFFVGRRRTATAVLHAFAPTPRQRLFYVCCLYHVAVEIGTDHARASIRSASAAEEALLAGKRKRPPTLAAWEIRLTLEQEQQLLALPKTIARPVHFPSGLKRIWDWLRGKSGQA